MGTYHSKTISNWTVTVKSMSDRATTCCRLRDTLTCVKKRTIFVQGTASAPAKYNDFGLLLSDDDRGALEAVAAS